MKTINIRNNKDNIASATVLSVSLLFVAASLFNSNVAEAAPKAAVQKMDTIVVTATRIAPAVRMETMLVTASRTTNHA